MGRPTKLTPAVQRAVCEQIERGLHLDDAAIMGGIGRTTFYTWMAKGDAQKRGRYRDFRNAVEAAKAQAAAFLIGLIEQAAERGSESVEIVTNFEADADGEMIPVSKRETKRKSPRDWRAALALLERREPARYGRKVIEHAGEIKTTGGAAAAPAQPVVVVFGDPEPEEGMDDGEAQDTEPGKGSP